jgi:hypothetical protein
LGKRSEEQFKKKLERLRTMSETELRKELAETNDSMKQIRLSKRRGGRCLTPRLWHNLRVYQRVMMLLLLQFQNKKNLLGGEVDG